MKKKRGDRKDGTWVRDLPGLNAIIPFIMKNRTEAEICLKGELDITNLMAFIEKYNEAHPDQPLRFFQCFITALGKLFYLRPRLNRFIKGKRIYQRHDVSIGFIVKQTFSDDGEESMLCLDIRKEDTLESIGKRMQDTITDIRSKHTGPSGIDHVISTLMKLPRPLLMSIVSFTSLLDFFGVMPAALTEGDMNYTSTMCTNLGSIGMPSLYHHLNNYGTCSMMVALGQIVKRDGRSYVDVSVTVDERIADGFYFSRSIQCMKDLLADPALLLQPMKTLE